MITEPRIITQEEFDALPDASNLNEGKPRIITEAEFNALPDAFVPNPNDSLEQTEENYYVNAAKLGLTDSISFVNATLDNLYEFFSPTGKLNPGNPNSVSLKQVGNYFGQTISKKTFEAQQDIKFLANQVGIDYQEANPNLAPSTGTERYLGGGVRFMADLPVSLLTGGMSKGRYAVNTGRYLDASLGPSINAAFRNLPGATVQQGAVGVVAEVGADVGGAVERGVTGEDTGLGRGLGGIATAFGAQKAFDAAPTVNLGQIPAKNALKNIYNWTSEKFGKPINTSSSSDVAASYAAKRFVKNAIAYEKGLPNFEKLNEDFNVLKEITSTKDYPIMMRLADNPQIMATVRKEFKNNPDFAQKYRTELEKYSQEIASNQSTIFGTLYENLMPVTKVMDEKLAQANQNRIAERQKIDAEIEDSINPLMPTRTPTERGEAVKKLVQDRKEVVYKEMTPHYDDLRNVATANKSVLSKEGVAQLFNFVRDNKLNNIFGIGTKVEKDVVNYLAPKEITKVSTTFKSGKKQQETKTTREHEPLDFNNVDSLKRAINRTKRGKLSAEQEGILIKFEDLFNQVASKNVTGGYFNTLKELDSLYYEKIGIPFNSKTIKEIDYDRYAQEIYPVIVKREQNLDEFLGAVGSKGYGLAKESLFADLHTKLDMSNFNPKVFNNYVKKHKYVIDKIPGLRKELDDIGTDFHTLSIRKGLIDKAAKEREKVLENNFLRHEISRLDGDANFTEAANTFLNKPGKRDEILENLNELKEYDVASYKMAHNKLRAEVVNLILDPKANFKGKSVIERVTSKDYAVPLSKLMGNDYQRNLKSFAKLQEAMSNAESVIPKMIEDRTKTAKFLNVSYKEITSAVAERLGGMLYKVRRLGNALIEANPGQGQKEVLDLILNPNSVKKFHDIAVLVEKQGITGGAVDRYISGIASLKPFHVISLKPGVLQTTNQDEE